MRPSRKIFAAAFAVAALTAGLATAADPFETRKATMKAIGGAFGGVLVKMAKGEVPYDAAAAKAAVDTLSAKAASLDADTLFPKGSETGGETLASPKIWQDGAGFKAAMADMQKAVATHGPMASQGLPALKAAVGDIGKTCKTCHDGYRLEKK